MGIRHKYAKFITVAFFAAVSSILYGSGGGEPAAVESFRSGISEILPDSGIVRTGGRCFSGDPPKIEVTKLIKIEKPLFPGGVVNIGILHKFKTVGRLLVNRELLHSCNITLAELVEKIENEKEKKTNNGKIAEPNHSVANAKTCEHAFPEDHMLKVARISYSSDKDNSMEMVELCAVFDAEANCGDLEKWYRDIVAEYFGCCGLPSKSLKESRNWTKLEEFVSDGNDFLWGISECVAMKKSIGNCYFSRIEDKRIEGRFVIYRCRNQKDSQNGDIEVTVGDDPGTL